MKIYCKKKKSRRRLVSFLLVLCLSISILIIGDCHLRPIIADCAQSNGESLMIQVADQTVVELLRENQITYEKLVTLTYNNEGQVTSLCVNPEPLNAIRAQLAVRMSEKISKRSSYDLSIPLGTLIGSEFTIGRGPCIPFRMTLLSRAVANFKSQFTSAGINQVLHQIVIHLSLSGQAVIPWFRSGFTTQMDLIVAETVIVGATPSSFTNVDTTDDHLTDDLFNFTDWKFIV